MTKKQEMFYWSLWSKVKASLLKRGYTKADADAQRHALHIKALGHEQSHLSMNNAQFDKVIAIFRAEFDDANMMGQIRQLAMPRERLIHLVDELLTVLEKDRSYAEGIIRRMNHEGELGAAELQIEDLTEEQIQTKLVVALKKACRRQWPSKDALLDAVRTFAADREFDEMAAAEAACKALKRTKLPPLHKLSYDQLLTVWAAFHNLPRGGNVAGIEETADCPF